MGQGNFRIIFSNFLDYLSPQAGGIQHVCLIDANNALAALHRDIECLDCDPADFIFIVGQGIYRGRHAVDLLRVTVTEVQTAGQLTHDNHIEAVADDLFL